MVINGVSNRVAPLTRTVINGATVVNQNGLGLPREYNKWNMRWNGYSFAPPEVGCVLYLPGHPGFGSTILDYSNTFYDSGLNTSEGISATETGIGTDADPATLLPVGSVIRLESELIYVSASGGPLGNNIEGIRGFEGTPNVSHAIDQDIYVRTANHGTISGAVWTQQPSGLWALSYDALDDYVQIAHHSSLLLTTGGTLLAWIKPTSAGEVNEGRIIDKSDDSNGLNGFCWRVRASVTIGRCSFVINASFVNASVDSVSWNVWQLVGVTFTAAGAVAHYVNGVAKGTGSTSAANLITSTVVLRLGQKAIGTSATFDGPMCLHRIFNTQLTAAQHATIFNNERYLFGV